MSKRGKLEIIRDILRIIKDNHNKIKPTPLLRKSNLSFERFSEYQKEIIEKSFMKEITDGNNKYLVLTEKGFRFIEKYKTIIDFIEEFKL